MYKYKSFISLKVLVGIFVFSLLFSGLALSAEFTVYLVDVSGSIGNNVNSPQLQGYLQAVKEDYRKRAGKRDNFKVIGFGRNTQSFLDLEMPSNVGSSKARISNLVNEADEVLDENIETRIVSINRSDTDVYGALLTAGGIFRNLPRKVKRTLYIYSDMQHDTENHKLKVSSPLLKERIANFKREISSRGSYIPELKGVNIYCHCKVVFDGNRLSSTQKQTAIRELQEFWEYVFTITKATVRRYIIA